MSTNEDNSKKNTIHLTNLSEDLFEESKLDETSKISENDCAEISTPRDIPTRTFFDNSRIFGGDDDGADGVYSAQGPFHYDSDGSMGPSLHQKDIFHEEDDLDTDEPRYDRSGIDGSGGTSRTGRNIAPASNFNAESTVLQKKSKINNEASNTSATTKLPQHVTIDENDEKHQNSSFRTIEGHSGIEIEKKNAQGAQTGKYYCYLLV